MKAVIFVLALIMVLMPFTDSVTSATLATRHTFTWISEVTPELAEWARDLSFTDVVVTNAGEADYLNLKEQGIEYWLCVSSFNFDSSVLESEEETRAVLMNLLQASPNRHLYLDDFHHLVLSSKYNACNNLLDTVRALQGEGYDFILDGLLHRDVGPLLNYSKVNMTDISFDVYQPLHYEYLELAPTLANLDLASIGFYVWAYDCWFAGTAWEHMTNERLTSIYEQAMSCAAARITVWNGYTTVSEDLCMNRACLYNYPEWWDEIRTRNMEFLGR